MHPASVQDRDGAEALLREARRSFPFLERIIADAGYQGRKMEAVVARTGTWVLEIVRRCDQHRFVVLPKRWIVERTLAWISRCRRLARDYERHARKAACVRAPRHDPPHAAQDAKPLITSQTSRMGSDGCKRSDFRQLDCRVAETKLVRNQWVNKTSYRPGMGPTGPQITGSRGQPSLRARYGVDLLEIGLQHIRRAKRKARRSDPIRRSGGLLARLALGASPRLRPMIAGAG